MEGALRALSIRLWIATAHAESTRRGGCDNFVSFSQPRITHESQLGNYLDQAYLWSRLFLIVSLNEMERLTLSVGDIISWSGSWTM